LTAGGCAADTRLELSVATVLEEHWDGFLAYPKRVEDEAEPSILALVRQTYGEERLQSYVTMFDANARKK
jgi:hypothetical protein